MPYETDSVVTKKLYEFAKRGPHNADFRLEEATPFVWDRVFFFHEGVKKQGVNDTTGQSFFRGNTERRFIVGGPLLVFMSQGEIIHAEVIIPPLFISGTGERDYTRDTAILVAHTKNPGPYTLVFQDYLLRKRIPSPNKR